MLLYYTTCAEPNNTQPSNITQAPNDTNIATTPNETQVSKDNPNLATMANDIQHSNKIQWFPICQQYPTKSDLPTIPKITNLPTTSNDIQPSNNTQPFFNTQPSKETQQYPVIVNLPTMPNLPMVMPANFCLLGPFWLLIFLTGKYHFGKLKMLCLLLREYSSHSQWKRMQSASTLRCTVIIKSRQTNILSRKWCVYWQTLNERLTADSANMKGFRCTNRMAALSYLIRTPETIWHDGKKNWTLKWTETYGWMSGWRQRHGAVGEKNSGTSTQLALVPVAVEALRSFCPHIQTLGFTATVTFTPKTLVTSELV